MLRRNRHSLILALAVLIAMAAAKTPEARASEPNAVIIGKKFDDGLDTRIAAEQVGNVLASLGYLTTTNDDGKTAEAAWTDGRAAAVFAAFGHANAGIMQTDEGVTDDQDQILAAGDPTYLNGDNVFFWGDYLPYLDVDDMRLAIFAGCDTARTDPYLGSFGAVGRKLGVDAVIGFNDLVQYPAFCTQCDYSGNFYWTRFAVYVQQGDTIALALSKARTDLVAQEGTSGGWDSWAVAGAAKRPGDVTLGGHGSTYNARPFGSASPDLPNPLGPGSPTGIVQRDSKTGDLVAMYARASTSGSQPLLPESAAAEIAMRHAETNVSWFDQRRGVDQVGRISHEPGDALTSISWRSMEGGVLGPELVEVEVDRRTGSIVYFHAMQAKVTSSRAFTILPITARRIAEQATAASFVSIVKDIWTSPRYIIQLRGRDGPTPRRIYVLVDGLNGKVVSRTAT